MIQGKRECTETKRIFSRGREAEGRGGGRGERGRVGILPDDKTVHIV